MTIERVRPEADPWGTWVEDVAQRKVDLGAVKTFAVYPTMRVELLFHFADPFETAPFADAPFVCAPPAAVLHARARKEFQRAGPGIDWFLVALTPLGARQLLGLPFSALRQAPIDLRDVWGNDCEALWRRLGDVSTLEERWSLFTTFARLRIRQAPKHAALIEALAPRALAKIERAGALAAELGYSERRVRQLVQAELGLGLKARLAIQRLNAQLEALNPNAPAKLKRESAHEYSDQSHATREFKRVTGSTPHDFVRARSKTGDTLSYTTPVNEAD
ncbi:MAG: hypothetical protein K2P70_04700 [Hyphomonadaceae bacterium]|nr:hypothetical protein [Hyphomonadaceae bacterium]